MFISLTKILDRSALFKYTNYGTISLMFFFSGEKGLLHLRYIHIYLNSSNNFNYPVARSTRNAVGGYNESRQVVRTRYGEKGGEGSCPLEQIKVAPLIARDNVTREDNTN